MTGIMESSAPSAVCRWHQSELCDRLRGDASLRDLSQLKIELHEHHTVQGHMQGHALVQGNPQCQYRLEDEWVEVSPADVVLEYWWKKFFHELAVCTCT